MELDYKNIVTEFGFDNYIKLMPMLNKDGNEVWGVANYSNIKPSEGLGTFLRIEDYVVSGETRSMVTRQFYTRDYSEQMAYLVVFRTFSSQTRKDKIEFYKAFKALSDQHLCAATNTQTT